MDIIFKVLVWGMFNYKNYYFQESLKFWFIIVLDSIVKDIGRKKYMRVLEIGKEEIILFLFVDVIIILRKINSLLKLIRVDFWM